MLDDKIAIKIDSVNERIDSLSRNETKSEITRLEERIDSVEANMKTRFEATDTKIDSLRNEFVSLRSEMNVKFDSLEKCIPVIEKMAVMERKIEELEKKLAAA